MGTQIPRVVLTCCASACSYEPPEMVCQGDDCEQEQCEAWSWGLVEGTWEDGRRLGCQEGRYSDEGHASSLQRLNEIRALADLPAVETDPDLNADAQACALMMHVNRDLDHDPPERWRCYSEEGASAAGLSNLSGQSSLGSMLAYMVDTGSEDSLGHRRWILSNDLGPVGIGSTSEASCLTVIGGSGEATREWTAWPPPGQIPRGALFDGWDRVEDAGLSIQSDVHPLNEA